MAASEALASRKGRKWNETAARRRPVHGHWATLLMLDAGLRMGEVAGLRWRDVTLGRSPADPRRFLHIRESIAAGRWETTPESGRTRRVDLSRRPPGNYRARHFDPACTQAGLSGYIPKDLRDTFASQLFSAGVELPYIQEMLGPADATTTVRNYAKATEEARHRPRIDLDHTGGERPVDLIERLCRQRRGHFQSRRRAR